MYDTCPLTKRKILRPGLKLAGAKTRNRWRFYPHFPAEYNTVCEPFMGTAGVLIGRDPVQTEYLNDFCTEAIDYYYVIVHHKHEFWYEWSRLLPKLLKHKEKFFQEMKLMIAQEPDIVKSSALFYGLVKTGFNGLYRKNKKGENNTSYCGTVEGRGFFTPDWLDLVSERVKDVHFTSNRFQDCIAVQNMQDPDGRFLFIDPPYRKALTKYMGEGFDDDDFRLLHSLIADAKYKWMLTINDDPFIVELFRDFVQVRHELHYSISQTVAGRGNRPELIIKNY